MTKTPKKPRRRTAYQAAVVRVILAFGPPRAHPGEFAFKKLPRKEWPKYLLEPYETNLMRDGTLAVIWFDVLVGDDKHLRYTDIEKTRHSNTPFGVFLDWCDDHGLKYEAVRNDQLPNAKFRRCYKSSKHFRVTIPAEAP